MDESDVIRRLGVPHEVVGRRERMLSRAWLCSTCRELTITPEPAPWPSRRVGDTLLGCRRCGGTVFENANHAVER